MSRPAPGDGDAELIRTGVAVLLRRCAAAETYAGLSMAAAEGLARTLRGVAAGAPELDTVDRGEVIALAHRLIDDDYPERSPLWPASGSAAAGPEPPG